MAEERAELHPPERDDDPPEVVGAYLSPGSQENLPLQVFDPTTDSEERRRIGSVRHHAVSALFSDLAKTARSFILYDPHNDAIRNFLTALLRSVTGVLAQEGDLRIRVQPFELWFEGEVIYLNRDRERSLAFRLYRDGVRGLTLHPGFDWSELLQLLQILSVRYTGVHQNEDDAVTLLWKARFTHLEVVAVEGFEAREERGGETVGEFTARVLARQSAGAEATSQDEPGDLGIQSLMARADYPGPYLPDFEAVAWVDVPEERLERLRDETSDHALPDTCMALLARIRPLLNDPDTAWRFAEVSHLYSEIRDFLLAAENLEYLDRFVAHLEELSLADAPPWDPWRREAVRKVLKGCGEEAAIRKILHTTTVDSRRMPPELPRIIGRVCDDPLSLLLDTFVDERSPAARAFARQLIELYGCEKVDLLQERFELLDGTVAADLLRAIANIDVEHSAQFIARQCWHPDADVQDEALHHLERIPYSGALGRILFEAVTRLEGTRRTRILRLILRSRDQRFVDRLATYVEDQAERLPPVEAEQIGRVMGRLGGTGFLPMWKSWLTPSGWLKKTLPGPLARQVAAVAALGEIAGDEAEEVTLSAREVAEGEVGEWFDRALQRRATRKSGS